MTDKSNTQTNGANKDTGATLLDKAHMLASDGLYDGYLPRIGSILEVTIHKLGDCLDGCDEDATAGICNVIDLLQAAKSLMNNAKGISYDIGSLLYSHKTSEAFASYSDGYKPYQFNDSGSALTIF